LKGNQFDCLLLKRGGIFEEFTNKAKYQSIKPTGKFSEKWKKQLDIADKAVYEAKKNGRNQISVSKEYTKFYKL